MWICERCGAEVEADWDTCWKCLHVRSDGDSQIAEQQTPTAPDPPAPGAVCAVCRSPRMLLDVLIGPAWEPARRLQAVVQRPGGGFLRRSTEHSSVHARACGACGHIMWFLDDPVRLWAAAQEVDEEEMEPLEDEDMEP